MKTKSFISITASLTAAMVCHGFALEAPEDDAPPPSTGKFPAAQLPDIKLQPDTQAVTEPCAFLGLVSSDLPEALAAHLDLKPGLGVMVRSLVQDGPAAKSGMQENDVITSIAGNKVGSPQDISQQISTHKPGEKIKVEVIQKGDPTQLEITLGTKPADLATTDPQALNPLELDEFPKELAERIRKAIAGNINGLELRLGKDEAEIAAQMEDAMRELKNRMQGALGQAMAPPAQAPDVQAHAGSTIRLKDATGSVEVKSLENSKEVTIRDAQDQVTWSGPWDTAQDQAAAPADVRRRVANLNIDNSFKGTGIRLQMNPPAQPGNPPAQPENPPAHPEN